MTAARPTMLSAVNVTNVQTLGNYLGALKNWVKLQQNFNCIFFVVDQHTITVRQDPKILKERTYHGIANYLAAGIDPSECTLFIQSHVAEHAQLSWVLTCFSTMGELNRMTQYKDKSAKHTKAIPTGIFAYPLLMAADILLYDTNQVPVGADQKQHVELTRDLAQRMNHEFGDDLFVIPEPVIPQVGAKIMSLQEPEKKMSKSDENAGATVFLTDSDADIEKKFKRAVTDSGKEITDDESKPGIRNLLQIQSSITGKPISEIVASYAGKQYGHLKVDTAEIVINELRPVREKTEMYLKDKAQLHAILKKGAERAREHASQTVARVYDRLGFIPSR